MHKKKASIGFERVQNTRTHCRSAPNERFSMLRKCVHVYYIYKLGERNGAQVCRNKTNKDKAAAVSGRLYGRNGTSGHRGLDCKAQMCSGQGEPSADASWGLSKADLQPGAVIKSGNGRPVSSRLWDILSP